jgi:hypothetical protein
MRAGSLVAVAALALPLHAAELPEIATPKTPWRMTFASDDVRLSAKEYKPGSDRGSFLMTRKDGVAISVFIEPATACQSAVQCRDALYKLLQGKTDGTELVAQAQLGDAYTIEAFRAKERNLPIHEKTLYAEFVVDGYWIDVRVAKSRFKDADAGKLEALVQSVRFEPRH